MDDDILRYLVRYYRWTGKDSVQYCDPIHGGIYEDGLARMMSAQGFTWTVTPDNEPTEGFLQACRRLAVLGLVRRMRRTATAAHLGIWPTDLGLLTHPF